MKEYIELGYVPADKRKDAATSCTLEYTYGDWCVGVVNEDPAQESRSG